MKEVTPQAAYEAMQNDDKIIYLDVRSVPEFDEGHVPDAINIPLMNYSPMTGMTPNPDFVQEVDAQVPKDAKIIVGCKSGGRSAKACEVMTQMGYTDVTNLRGGFVGAADASGRLVEPGWSMLNLPVER